MGVKSFVHQSKGFSDLMTTSSSSNKNMVANLLLSSASECDPSAVGRLAFFTLFLFFFDPIEAIVHLKKCGFVFATTCSTVFSHRMATPHSPQFGLLIYSRPFDKVVLTTVGEWFWLVIEHTYKCELPGIIRLWSLRTFKGTNNFLQSSFSNRFISCALE